MSETITLVLFGLYFTITPTFLTALIDMWIYTRTVYLEKASSNSLGFGNFIS